MTTSTIRIERTLRGVIVAVTGVLVFLMQIGIGSGFPSSLDAGWGEVLNWGIAHGAQWGKDLVFTYGPLGFLSTGLPFDPAIYWPALILQCAFAAVITWLVVANLRWMSWAAILAFLPATIFLGWGWSSTSPLLLVYPLAMLVLERNSRETGGSRWRSYALVAGLSAFASLPPLVKFSAFPLWLVWLPLGCVVLYRPHAPRLVATFLVTSLVAPVVAWLACAQNLANLPAFVAGSWRVARFYGAAMQADPKLLITDQVALGTALFGLGCITLFAWRERQSLRRLAVYGMLAAALALAYRAGALRADGGHLMVLWSMSAWSACLLVGAWLERKNAAVGLRATIAAFVLAALALTPPYLSDVFSGSTLATLYSGRYTYAYSIESVDLLLHPRNAYDIRLKKWKVDRKALALPRIARTVGDGTVDVLMNEQATLLANGLNYYPRPVFQSYSAYSGQLAKRNAEFFTSARAPEWVMLDLYAIGGRYPASDDARALLRILQDYRPLLSEGDFILFHRNRERSGPLVEGGPSHEISVDFAKASAVPAPSADAWFATLHVGLTRYGKLQALLFRPPTLKIVVTLKDGSSHLYTLVPEIARTGFMLSPALASNAAYLDWLRGNNDSEVTSVRLVQQQALNHQAFRIEGDLHLYPLKLPRGYKPTLALYSATYPGFSEMPVSISEATRNYTVDGQPVMFLPAPGSLTFRLPGGTYQISATFGLMPDALGNPTCLAAHSDGIGMSVGIEGASPDPDSLQYINPFTDPRHRYKAHYTYRLTVPAGHSVVVSVNSGPPGSNGACDWSWLRNVRFTPVADAPTATTAKHHQAQR